MTELRAPRGRFRVIYVDLFSHEDGVIGDFATREEAFVCADEHNRRRVDPMEDVFYVYDDRGRYLRGAEAVGGKVSP
jgi:hypothetical protein